MASRVRGVTCVVEIIAMHCRVFHESPRTQPVDQLQMVAVDPCRGLQKGGQAIACLARNEKKSVFSNLQNSCSCDLYLQDHSFGPGARKMGNGVFMNNDRDMGPHVLTSTSTPQIHPIFCRTQTIFHCLRQ